MGAAAKHSVELARWCIDVLLAMACLWVIVAPTAAMLYAWNGGRYADEADREFERWIDALMPRSACICGAPHAQRRECFEDASIVYYLCFLAAALAVVVAGLSAA